MSNRELPYTQNPSPLFENVVFGNFSDQPGRHAADPTRDPFTDLHDGGDLATYDQVQRDLEGGSADPGLTVSTYQNENAAREGGTHDLEAFWIQRSAYGARLRARRDTSSRFSSGDEIAPVTFLPGVENPRDQIPPDDAS